AGFVLDGAIVVIERTIPLPGGAMITKRTAGDVWSYPNLHGDVFAVANATGIKDGSTRHYDPFGEALGAVPDNSAGSFDHGWLGQHQRPFEAEAGIATIEMGARPYVPALGRFLEVDPVEGGSANDYEYGGGDPVNAIDLDGRFCDWCQRMWHIFRYKKNFRWTVAGWAIARSQGATCKWRKGLMVVCTGARWAGFRGGMTIGNTYITTAPVVSAGLLAHETKHADQWALFGWLFVPLYLLAEAVSWIWGARGRYAGCKNFFEKWAGLAGGGYKC
ncbi:MAG: RHS repeat-associated core domain-containing protein, partial [Actinomycetota bacterium]